MGSRTAIGLDIGSSAVRAAELSFGKSGVTLQRLGQVALPDGAVRDGEVVDAAAVSMALRHLWSRTGLSHKNVVLGVANQQVVVRTVNLPRMPLAELRASLPLQVGDMLPMPVHSAALDFYPLDEITDANGAQLRGLLVAASLDMVTANVRAVEAAGLRVSTVDLTPFAVLRAMGTSGVADYEVEALVDVGATVTNIVVHSAGVPRFVRILLMGGEDVTDAVADELGVTQLQAEAFKHDMSLLDLSGDTVTRALQAVDRVCDAFAVEVRGSLEYFEGVSGTGPVDQIVLSGGGSQLAGLADRLQARTGVRVRIGDPMSGLRVGSLGLSDEQLRVVRPLSAVPVGLALGAGA